MILKKEERKIFKKIGKYILFSLLIFFIFLIAGVFFVFLKPSLCAEYFEKIRDSFSVLFDLHFLALGVFIFLNNSLKIFLFIFLGVFLGVPTFFFLALNGWVLGIAGAIAYSQMGIKDLFLSLFFHGIFEITALLIGSAIGFWIGEGSWREFKKKKKLSKKEIFCLPLLRKRFSFALHIFFYIIVPLLFLAALIETALIFI